jgi:hypothetical protein
MSLERVPYVNAAVDLLDRNEVAAAWINNDRVSYGMATTRRGGRMKFGDIAVGQSFVYMIGDNIYDAVKIDTNSWESRKRPSTGNYSVHHDWNDISQRFIVSIGNNNKNIVEGATKMFQGIAGDLKGYLSANKDLIYGLVLILLIDQYVFEGAFRNRIKGIVEGLLKKAEDQAGVGTTINTTAVKVE